MANIGDLGSFCLAEGVYRPCVVVKGPIDVEGISHYDIVVSVSPDDDEYLLEPERVAFQPIQTVGDYAHQAPVRTLHRRVREDTTAPPDLGRFHIPA